MTLEEIRKTFIKLGILDETHPEIQSFSGGEKQAATMRSATVQARNNGKTTLSLYDPNRCSFVVVTVDSDGRISRLSYAHNNTSGHVFLDDRDDGAGKLEKNKT